MTLEQLRIFLAVSEMLHFTRAAEALYITQPAVSAAIQTLETEYGTRLFHRIGRHIEITDAGKLLQGEAQKILDHVQLTERGLRELNNLQRGELKLGASLTVGNYWLPEKISQFKQLYPGIYINCKLGNAEEICEGTAVGMYDLGLVTGEIKASLQHCLEKEEVGSDRLQIVVSKFHPWFQRNPIQLGGMINPPNKPGRLAITKIVKPKYCPAIICRHLKLEFICENSSNKITISSILVPINADIPTKSVVINSLITIYPDYFN